MKFNAAFCAAILASTSTVASAAPAPAPGSESVTIATRNPERHLPDEWITFCHLAGQSCFKLKRAVDAASAALAPSTALAARDPKSRLPDHWITFCHLEGESCFKAKRSAEDLASAVAEARTTGLAPLYQDESPSPSPSTSTSSPPAAAAPAQVFARRGLRASPAGFPLPTNATAPELGLKTDDLCKFPGQPCEIVQRAIDAITAALDDTAMPLNTENREVGQADAGEECNGPDGECTRANFAIENLKRAAAKAQAAMGTST